MSQKQETPQRVELPLRIFVARPAGAWQDCEGCVAFEDPKHQAGEWRSPAGKAFANRCAKTRQIPIHGTDREWSCAIDRDGNDHGEILVEIP